MVDVVLSIGLAAAIVTAAFLVIVPAIKAQDNARARDVATQYADGIASCAETIAWNSLAPGASCPRAGSSSSTWNLGTSTARIGNTAGGRGIEVRSVVTVGWSTSPVIDPYHNVTSPARPGVIACAGAIERTNATSPCYASTYGVKVVTVNVYRVSDGALLVSNLVRYRTASVAEAVPTFTGVCNRATLGDGRCVDTSGGV